jgi:peptidase E
MEPANPLLDDYVLSLSRRQPARVCFLATASGDSPAYVARFYRSLAGRCVASDLTLLDSALPRRPSSTSDIETFIRDQDVFYVGGGSTVHLLALWRAYSLDRLLRDAWLGGAVLCGVSAGMNCWFSASITDSFGALAPLNDGLGFLPGSACPHYDSDEGRRPAFHDAIAAGLPPGYAADDGAGLRFVGEQLVEVVASRGTAKAYRVALRDNAVDEQELAARFLGE